MHVCGNAPFEVSGPGRLCYRSTDNGATFSPTGYVFPSAAQPAVCSPLAANNGSVGLDGTVYQPVSCSNTSYVAVSTDAGSIYTWHRFPTHPERARACPASPSRPPPTTPATSTPCGPRAITCRCRSPATTPRRGVRRLTAGSHGHVGVGYYATSPPGAPALTAWAVQSSDATAARPTWTNAALSDPKHPDFTNYGIQGPSPRADYLGATFGPGDRLWLAFVRQTSAPTSDSRIATLGMVGSVLTQR